jgi:hypothetical protein
MKVFPLRHRHAGTFVRLGVIGLCLLLGLIAGTNHLHAKTKPQFAPSVLITDQTIPLRGTGRLVWMRLVTVYDAALYLPAGVPGKDVLTDVPKQLELSYHISIKGPKFGESAEPYLEKNVPPQDLAKLRPRIEQLNKLYRDVKEGDRYALTYAPGKGTTLSLNNEPLGTIEGADFAAAYFAIWIGAKPISDSMRDDLVGLTKSK